VIEGEGLGASPGATSPTPQSSTGSRARVAVNPADADRHLLPDRESSLRLMTHIPVVPKPSGPMLVVAAAIGFDGPT
jgi:hypothetical protein